jgi:multidrug efflux pump subunit AcrA (membrane-fusion protein)
MNKIIPTLTLLCVSIFAIEIPTQKVQMHSFSQSKKINAKVIQLSNAQEAITSVVSGHLEKYFVRPAQIVKKGQKIALIESIVVSKMSADYLSLKKQLKASQKNYEALKRLYDKGMTSMAKLNNESIKTNAIAAKLNALQSQLSTLGIETSKLTQATANYTLYAHSGGKISALLKPLHSAVNENEPLANIAKEQAYYIKSYLPLDYASKVKLGDTVVVDYGGKKIDTHITQIMPKVDEDTQRIIALSSVDEKVKNLFIDAYVEATLYFGKSFEHLAVKKSGLSFFDNEWVVFVPNDEAEKSEQEGAPYEIKVVKILDEDEGYAAVDGLQKGEVYVSDKSYYVKSALLKSSLGDGD